MQEPTIALRTQLHIPVQEVSSVTGELLDAWRLTKPVNYTAPTATARQAAIASELPAPSTLLIPGLIRMNQWLAMRHASACACMLPTQS